MKKLLITFTILLGITLNSNAQIESLAGPRLGIFHYQVHLLIKWIP